MEGTIIAYTFTIIFMVIWYPFAYLWLKPKVVKHWENVSREKC